MCQWVEAIGCGFVVVGLLGWWSLERLGWDLAAVLWWVPIGVVGVVGFGCSLCREFFLLFILVVGG